jgi:hypothetical protein
VQEERQVKSQQRRGVAVFSQKVAAHGKERREIERKGNPNAKTTQEPDLNFQSLGN